MLAGLMAAALAWVLSTQVLPLPEDATQDNQAQTTKIKHPPTATPEPISIDPTTIYNLINAHRKEHKLSALLPNTRLEMSAAAKIDDMITHGYWRHQDKQQLESWYLFKEAGYNYSLAGENLAFAATSEWQIFSDWVASPTHNKQLLIPDYEHMGLVADCKTYTELAGGGCLVVLHLGQQGL